MKKTLYILLAIVVINACKNENESKLVGDAKFYIKKNGPSPVLGDKVKMSYKMFYTEPSGEEVLLFSSIDSLDQQFDVAKDFVGGPTDCIMQMGIGDSAEFKVSADSIYRLQQKELKSYMQKGDKLKLVVKLKDIIPQGGGDVKIQLDPTIKAN